MEDLSLFREKVRQKIDLDLFYTMGPGVLISIGKLEIKNKEENKMKKVFISQPMRGKTDEEIIEVRKRAISYAKDALGTSEVEVIDSFFQGAPVDVKPLWFLGKSLELLSTADIAVFAPGYEEYRACKIEHTCAVEYGIETIEMK